MLFFKFNDIDFLNIKFAVIMKKIYGQIFIILCRIETILNSDRILMMEQGRVKELDTPRKLLDNPNSLFSALYREHSN